MSGLQKILKHTDLLLGMGMLMVVGMLILPLPAWLLDTGLVVAICSSVLILLTAVNVKEPLQFSVFPSLLLVTTLFRLALSVAATKLILGSGTGGHVIETFGEFVLGELVVVAPGPPEHLGVLTFEGHQQRDHAVARHLRVNRDRRRFDASARRRQRGLGRARRGV